jgi:hypothetical protein
MKIIRKTIEMTIKIVLLSKLCIEKYMIVAVSRSEAVTTDKK